MKKTITICKLSETESGVKIKFREDGRVVYREFPFTNYFYVLADEFDDVSNLILPRAKSLKRVKDKNGIEYVRIYLQNNFHRNMIRNDIEETGAYTFEADIPSGKRMLIENQNFDLNQEHLKIAFYDIETDDRKPFVKDMKGEIVPLSPITSMAVKEFKRDGDGDVWYIRNEGLDKPEFDEYRKNRNRFLELKKKTLNVEEKEEFEKLKEYFEEEYERVDEALLDGEKILLNKYFDYVKRYDVVSAWNGRQFDDAYVRFRANKHKLSYDNLNIVGFDYMESYKKNHLGAVKSFKLNDVAYEELKSELDKENSILTHPDEIRKVDWRKTTIAHKYFDLFLLFPDIHKEYNIQDVQLLDMMEKKLGFFKLHYTQCKKAHCLLIDTLYNSRICDIMVLNECRKRNIIKISKPTEQEVKSRESKIPPGGFTFCYKPGLHWGVMCFDFASHYVNIIRTFNISPENYIRFQMPDLSKVFSVSEIEYINYCVEEAKHFVDKQNKFAKKKYEKHIEEKRLELGVEDMEKLMWKFIRNYDNKIEHKENEIFTPSCINYDTRGWNVHPHFIFDNTERAIYPTILDDTNEERNKTKYSMKDFEVGSFVWQEHNYYQLGLKLLGNCFSLDTEIMTVDGAKNVRDIKVGDKCWSLNKETNEVEEATVIKEIYQPHNGDMIHFKNQNTDLLVTPNHRMIRQRYTTKENWECEAQDCMNGLTIPNHKPKRKVEKFINLLDFVDKSKYEVDGGKTRLLLNYENNWTKRGVNNFVWNDFKIDTKSFSKIVGWYIADGSLHRTSKNGFNISIAKRTYTKEREKINNLLVRFIKNLSRDDNNFHFASALWYEILEKFGSHGYKKNIPKEFKKYLDYDILFESLYECDGNKGRLWRYNTTSDKLKDNMKEICFYLNRNYNAILEQNGKNKSIWRIFCSPLKNTKHIHKESVSKISDKKFDYVACITLDKNNTVYAGRNNTFTWTFQSLYGYTGYRGSRDYMLDIPTAITSSARYMTKVCMVEAWDNDMSIINGDTDSIYCVGDKSKEDLDVVFKESLDKKLPIFNAKNHTINFEYEDTYDAMIPVKKKRYYYLKDDKIGGKGGIQTRSDVLEIAKDLQKELLDDIFYKKFDKEHWKKKLFDLKIKVENYELEEEHIVRISGLSKPIEEYGKPMIDGKTGLQKMTKDGKPRFSPIPANVQIAKRLIEEGENVDVGDKIHFVVLEQKPKIKPITLKEYREIKKYDAGYYYEKIIKGLIEILSVTHKEEVYTYFKNCWLFSDRQLKTLIQKQEEDED